MMTTAGDDDDALEEMIRDSIAKRDKKAGTEILKKVKGKNKLVKGEVGGGSFQSMGMSFQHSFFLFCKSEGSIICLTPSRSCIRGSCAP